MTFPRKTSRSIVVDGQNYRWTVSKLDQDKNLRLIIEDQKFPGRCAIARLGPFYSTETMPAITPAVVRSFVHHAKHQSWTPESTSTERIFKDFRLPKVLETPHFPTDPEWRLMTRTDLAPVYQKYPWDHHVNLFGCLPLDGATNDKCIGTIVASLASDLEIRPDLKRDPILQKLDQQLLDPDAYDAIIDKPEIENFSCLYIRGGRVLMANGEIVMYHGCCTTIDEWIDWRDLSKRDYGPWNGHDPMSSAILEGDSVRFSLDSNLSPEEEPRVSLGEYEKMAQEMKRDLHDFCDRLSDWLLTFAPDGSGQSLADKIKEYLHLTSY